MITEVSSLREKGIKAVVAGPDSSETENKKASEGRYNPLFTSPEALFGSHQSTKAISYTTFRSASFHLSQVRFCCLPRLSR